MQNLYKTILLFFAFWVATNIINAQSNSTLMRAEMRSFITEDEKVMLRWAPADFAAWEWGINHGYILKRTTIKSGGVPVDVGEAMLSVLLDPEIKPWDESEFNELINSDTSDWALIGAGSIYGEGFTVLDPNTTDIMDIASLNKEQQNRYSFGLFAAEQSFAVATAMGLAFIDLNAEPDKEYLYFLEMKDAASGTAKETYLKVNMNAASVLPSPRLSIVAGDKSVTLRWERDDLEQYYNSYIVERSDDKGETYTRINDKPIVFVSDNDKAADALFFGDSLAQNSVPYSYRIRGVTTFATYGPSSNTVEITGTPGPVEGIIFKTYADPLGETQFNVHWDVTPEIAANITSFVVLRAPEVSKPFEIVSGSPLPNTTLQWLDEAPLPVNYYIIESTDVNGHTHRSPAIMMQLNDANPPAVLPAPVCTCNKEGKIKISWQPATEDDLLGYRVFISNNNNPGDMLQITTDIIKDTLYFHQVTMNTLSENIYFSVRALDMRENMSPLSPPCLAVRPDVIPPSAPVIVGYTHELNGTRFTYQASTSDDVVSYELQRRLKSYVKWDMISKTTPNQLKPFTDTTAFRRHRYEYRLVAFDETGLGGSSAILDVKPFDDGVRDSIHNLLATKVGGPPPAAVVLSWNYPQFRDPDLIGFQILRAVGGDPMRTLVFLNLLQADAANNGVLDPLAVPGAFGFADLDTREFRQIINQGLVMPISAVPSLTGGATGVAVRYSVYAKYIDGAMSPLANITVTW